MSRVASSLGPLPHPSLPKRQPLFSFWLLWRAIRARSSFYSFYLRCEFLVNPLPRVLKQPHPRAPSAPRLGLLLREPRVGLEENRALRVGHDGEHAAVERLDARDAVGAAVRVVRVPLRALACRVDVADARG